MSEQADDADLKSADASRVGSSPTIRTKVYSYVPKTMAEKFPLVSISDYLLCYARVAQLVEHQTFNLGVAGSNPATGTISTQSDVVYR